MFVDVSKAADGTATQWVVESGVVQLFLFAGPSPSAVVKQYAAVTGTTALPQLFAIGYHQVRGDIEFCLHSHTADWTRTSTCIVGDLGMFAEECAYVCA
jgi:alpha-glucosidase (family GH31 glycosyl hydrolase)